MASVEELLLNSLMDLLQDDLKLFQWHLRKNHECISKSEMENADRLKTVDKMVACFGQEEAVKITVNILRKVNQNHLAEQLENEHKKVSHPERNNSDTHTTGFSEKHLEKGEPCLNSDADKARYFDKHWSEIIQGVTNAQIIADKLCQQKLLHEEQYSEITQSLTSQESMREICNIIRKHRDPVKAKFISVLQEEKLYHF
ncbi:apoptosis-associated speck-like protein containing a CARD [Siphateles boraxobius]|uniref:apoptosis-associated speck-like protein containing a CARD n=1 Tax=Siphateles boraxobius TaxID=180520 RepID=UPI004063CFD4